MEPLCDVILSGGFSCRYKLGHKGIHAIDPSKPPVEIPESWAHVATPTARAAQLGDVTEQRFVGLETRLTAQEDNRERIEERFASLENQFALQKQEIDALHSLIERLGVPVVDNVTPSKKTKGKEVKA